MSPDQTWGAGLRSKIARAWLVGGFRVLGLGFIRFRVEGEP